MPPYKILNSVDKWQDKHPKITNAINVVGTVIMVRQMVKATPKSSTIRQTVPNSVEKAGKAVEELPSKIRQTFTKDLSIVTGNGGQARNRAIDAMIKEDFPNLNLTYKPEYNPFIRTGIAQEGSGTQIGKNMFSSRTNLRDTIIHEELHQRWWKQGIYDHHPVGSELEESFYKTIDRYFRLRGWDK